MLKEILENKKDQKIIFKKSNSLGSIFEIIEPSGKKIEMARRIMETGTIYKISINDQQTQTLKCASKEETLQEVSGDIIVPESEYRLLIQICETIFTFDEITLHSNKEFYITFDAIERIIRENMEAKAFLLQEWALKVDFLKLGNYQSTALNHTMEVELKSQKEISIIFKDNIGGYTERYDLTKKGLYVSSTASKRNRFLTSDTGFLIKEAVMSMYKKQKNEILDIKQLIDNDNFYNMELKDLYIFKRTWMKGFHDRTILEEKVELIGEEKELLKVAIYEKIKPSKKKIEKEDIQAIERFPEKIKVGTNYLFDSDTINQKIYQYEKVLTDLEANLDKMNDEDRKYVTSSLREDEVEFILCANNFSNEELKIYLNEYLNHVIESMQNIFNDLKTDYEEKMKLLLKIVSKRRSI